MRTKTKKIWIAMLALVFCVLTSLALFPAYAAEDSDQDRQTEIAEPLVPPDREEVVVVSEKPLREDDDHEIRDAHPRHRNEHERTVDDQFEKPGHRHAERCENQETDR